MKKTKSLSIIKAIIIIIIIALIAYGTYMRGLISLHKGQKNASVSQQHSTAFPLLTGTLLLSPFKSHEGVIDMIKNAKYTIYIWGYQISDKAFINTLKQKEAQGVKIRIILENSTYGGNNKEFKQLLKQVHNTTISVQSDEHLETNFQHAKTIIIDNESFLVSSANFTYGGFFANREHWFIASEPLHTQLLSQQFESDRTDTPLRKISYPSSLRICPYNCRNELTALINQAQSSISIQAQYLEDPLLIDQLIAKKATGVTIRIIVGKYHDTLLPSSLTETVRTMSDPNVHAKAILVDGSKLYLGSMNLSTNAVEKNREIGIVTSDKFVIRQFTSQFDQDRHSISP